MYFQTERLIVNQLTLDDIEGFSYYRNKNDVYKYQSWNGYSIDDARFRIGILNLKQFSKESKDYNVAIRYNGQLIGDLFLSPNNENRITIGYTLDSEYWRQGFATEVLNGLFIYLKEEFGFEEVVCHIYKQNIASRNLLLKYGFKLYKKSSFFNDESYIKKI